MSGGGRLPRRYTVDVEPVGHGDSHGMRLKITDSAGTVIRQATVTDVVFSASLEAAAAGWRLADEWIAQISSASPIDEPKPLATEERAFLVGCDHGVARCEACRLHHRLFELYADRFCARCRADLTVQMRRHLRECPEIVIHRSEAVGTATEMGHDENAGVREASEVRRTENEALPQRTRRTRERRPPPTRPCPVCEQLVTPGDPVSFRHGVVVHLRCYEAGRQPT